MTDVGTCTLFSFKVILTSFQSISIISHSNFLFNIICSEVNFPVILNGCILPTVMYNFTST